VLADELVARLDLRPGLRVLEPSAGRGSLLRAVRRRCKRVEIVAVERLRVLCDSLERQGFAPRCEDFLEIRPGELELVDRVVMNPPFSRAQDIAHVRHAMRFLRPGGVLVAVMSAGVKFRQDRAASEFRAYVESIGGTIDDLPEGSFAAAGTMVRTVVVRLVQPGAVEGEPAPELEPEVEPTSAIVPAEPEGESEPEEPGQSFNPGSLAVRRTIVELVRVFRQAEQDITEAFATVVRAEEALERAFGVGESSRRGFAVRDRHGGRVDFRSPEEAIRELRRDAWHVVIERMELQRFMSDRAWRELYNQVEKSEPPELTEETVLGLLKQHHDALEDHIREAVREVFDFLRPWNSTYKTNQKWEIGKAVILGYAVEPKFTNPRAFGVEWRRKQELICLENVLNYLDGRGQVNKMINRSELELAIEASPDGRGETRLFKFKCFKNKNLHLTFKRPDLVARLNIIAGGGALKPKE
jgi:hypothetical protein